MPNATEERSRLAQAAVNIAVCRDRIRQHIEFVRWLRGAPFDTLRAQTQMLELLRAQRKFLRDLRASRTAILEALSQATCER